MIFGYSTNAFKKFTLIDSIEKIARLGFKGVEIMGDRPHLYPPDFAENQLTHLNEVIAKNNLTVTNLNSFTLFAVGDTYLPSWIEPEKERREIRIRHTLDSLQVAKKLGCGSISIPPGGPLAGNSFCTFKLTERTGHGDLRTTRSVVDPKNSVLTNPCPLTPSTIMSMSFDSA